MSTQCHKTPTMPSHVKKKPAQFVSRVIPEPKLATKTPQVAPNPQLPSRAWTEFQPRASSRFVPEQRNRPQPQATNEQDLASRLNSFLTRNLKPRHQQAPSQGHGPSHSQPSQSQHPIPRPISTVAPPTIAPPASQQPIRQIQIQPPSTAHRLAPKTPINRAPILPKTSISQHNPQQPHHLNASQPTSDEQLQNQQPPRLIQDTRVPNRPGPIATATKAPLSVSQYTQPTPSSNKSTGHQVSRAHSEPLIKYQVKVNDKTYKILRKIGSGGSAKVYEGFEPTTYQTVAIKIINVGQADPKTQESYFNEKKLLSSLQDSKHVVRIFNSEYKSECKELVIVMEKGDADLSQVLHTHFISREGRRIDGVFIKFYWRGMLMAVNEIHKHGIVHADLKPVNFILVKNQIKLIDFGIASSVDPGGTSIIRDYQIGTINYMAPETLRNRANDASFVIPHDENNDFGGDVARHKRTVIKYNSKADIWSLGCILYNFVYGRPPFDSYQDILSKLQAITNPNHKIDFPRINNTNLLSCMKACLEYDKEKRPSAEELLNHPYLQEDVLVLDSM